MVKRKTQYNGPRTVARFGDGTLIEKPASVHRYAWRAAIRFPGSPVVSSVMGWSVTEQGARDAANDYALGGALEQIEIVAALRFQTAGAEKFVAVK